MNAASRFSHTALDSELLLPVRSQTRTLPIMYIDYASDILHRYEIDDWCIILVFGSFLDRYKNKMAICMLLNCVVTLHLFTVYILYDLSSHHYKLQLVSINLISSLKCCNMCGCALIQYVWLPANVVLGCAIDLCFIVTLAICIRDIVFDVCAGAMIWRRDSLYFALLC